MKSFSLWLAATTLASATEVVYLGNDVNGNSEYSSINYYSNIDNSHNQQFPDDVADINGSDNEHWQHWEGQAVSGTFYGSHVTFTSHIDANAGGYAVGQYAGWGTNGYHNFACFRDNGQILYISGSHIIHKIYYCKQT